VALRLARQWQREPDWFYGLTTKEQTKLLALYRIETTPPEDLKQKKTAGKAAQMRAAIKKYATRDSING
jgi:hypothetical protein